MIDSLLKICSKIEFLPVDKTKLCYNFLLKLINCSDFFNVYLATLPIPSSVTFVENGVNLELSQMILPWRGSKMAKNSALGQACQTQNTVRAAQ